MFHDKYSLSLDYFFDRFWFDKWKAVTGIASLETIHLYQDIKRIKKLWNTNWKYTKDIDWFFDYFWGILVPPLRKDIKQYVISWCTENLAFTHLYQDIKQIKESWTNTPKI